MLSVFSTLKETFHLWVQNFWYLAALSLFTAVPNILAKRLEELDHHSHSLGMGGGSLLLGVVGMFFGAVTAAAILGLLRRDIVGTKIWAAIRDSVAFYTWTLLRLSFLLIWFALLAVIPFVAITMLFGPVKFLTVFLIAIYLVFLKYALADPLIVVENLNASDALWRSWEMTKGRFWYVLGCYIVLSSGNWLIQWAITSPVPSLDSGLGWAWLPVQYGVTLYNTLWIVLSWCMYLRIKETEAEPPSFSEEVPASPT